MTDKVTITSDSTIPSILNQRIHMNPDRIALISGSKRVTFKDLGEQVHHIASVLQDLGIDKGEKVAIIYPSGVEFPATLLAIYQMGAVPLSLNPTLKSEEIKYILHHSETVAVIVLNDFQGIDPLGTILHIQDELPHLRYLVSHGSDTRADYQLDNLLLETEPRLVNVDIHPDDLAVLIYTSGTTGLPKGGMHTHRTQLVNIGLDHYGKPSMREIFLILRRYGLGYFIRVMKIMTKTMVFLTTVPPCGAAGVFGAVMSILTGKTLVLKDHINPIETLEIIEKEKVNALAAVPSLLALITKRSDLNKYDLSSLIFIKTGAAYVSPALAKEIREKLGCPALIAYGGTEFGTPTMTNPFSDSDKALTETVGKVGKNYQVKIVDENRKELPTGEVGEIVVRGPSLMIGYYKDEEATRQTRDEEGWVYTGDLGSLDENGYLRIAGRIKDMIIRGGQNIYPAEIEDVLVNHPKIHRAAVIGVPDDIAGERVIAFVIPFEGESLDQVEALDHCRRSLAPYKIPSEVRFMEDFPMNEMGKVLKRQLREDTIAEINQAALFTPKFWETTITKTKNLFINNP